MFIVIRGIVRLGVMEFIAGLILLMLILWISAFTSAFVDNIPFVMSMIPVIKSISNNLGFDPTPLY